MKQTVLGILSPNKNAYSETFILAHKKLLPFPIKFYHSGWVPTALGSNDCIDDSILSKIKSIFYPKFTYKEYIFYKSLKREKVNFILAEYGPTAAETLNVIKLLKLPLVVHFHGFDASRENVLEQYKSSYQQVFEYAKKVVVVSNKMYNDLINLGCPKQKIVLTRCGPDNRFLDIEPKFDKQQFVSVGRFVDKKAPYLTIAAFIKVLIKYPDTKLIMCGSGPLLNACKNLVQIWGIGSSVCFRGATDPGEVINLFQESLAYVQHSIIADDGDSEGTPVAILEACAAGLPVVATRHAGISDVIIDGETGFLVEELDVDAMANRMIQLIEDKKLARTMGITGRNRIKENFTIDNHIDTIASLIA